MIVYMKVKHDFEYPDQTIKAGTILGVEAEGGDIRYILEGELKNRSVHMEHLIEADVTKMSEELIWARSEIDRLRKLVEQSFKDEIRATQAADRFQEINLRLKSESKRLMDEVDETSRDRFKLQMEVDQLKGMIPEKVKLPREVAEAIERLHNADISDFGIIALSDQTALLGRDYSKEIIEDLKLIHPLTFINSHEDAVGDSGADILLKALVNGYAIEETPEDEMQQGIKDIVHKWLSSEPIGDNNDEDNAELARRITKFVQKKAT